MLYRYGEGAREVTQDKRKDLQEAWGLIRRSEQKPGTGALEIRQNYGAEGPQRVWEGGQGC